MMVSLYLRIVEKETVPIDINGIGFIEIIDGKTGELLLDVVMGDGNGDVDCSLCTLK